MAKRININSSEYEKLHLRRIEKYAGNVDDIYASAVAEFAKLAKSITGYNPDKLFSFSDYPETKRMVDLILSAVHSQVLATAETGIDAEWLEAAVKNDKLVDQLSTLTGISKKDLSKYYDRNLDALKAFKDRKTDGLNLSDRVWKHTDNLLPEVEMIMDRGLAEGKSAAALSRETRKYLNEPDRIFRRVRNDKGELVLSKAARSYHPGQGVYRSSSKNAKRLTRDIINESYRESDWQRYQQLDFVVGFEIKLSTNPYHCPVCEALAGKYPKSFKWTKWHVQCRCFIIPIMMTEEEMDANLERALNGMDELPFSENTVTGMPANFTKFMSDNEDKFIRAKKQPYWVRDNFEGGDPAKGLKPLLITESAPKIEKRTSVDLSSMIKGDLPTNAEIKNIMGAVADLKPEYFRNGLEAVKFQKSRSYMMQHSMAYSRKTGDWAGKSTITISTNTFESIGFNPAEELRGALGAIKAGKDLTFNQEYSVESLWHEILHATTKSKPQALNKIQIQNMETLNQFTARHTYSDFIELLGGKASNQAEILDNGFGYKKWIENFRGLLKKNGIPEDVAVKEFRPFLMSDYGSIGSKVMEYIKNFKP